jgi:hypothetical protein
VDTVIDDSYVKSNLRGWVLSLPKLLNGTASRAQQVAMAVPVTVDSQVEQRIASH